MVSVESEVEVGENLFLSEDLIVCVEQTDRSPVLDFSLFGDALDDSKALKVCESVTIA